MGFFTVIELYLFVLLSLKINMLFTCLLINLLKLLIILLVTHSLVFILTFMLLSHGILQEKTFT